MASSRISEPAYQIVSGVFFGIALAVAACRIVIRLWIEKRLRLDDYLLLCACACLAAATGVLYYGSSTEFFSSRLALDPVAVLSEGVSEEDIAHKLELLTRINWTYLTLSWVTIFLIKYGFLALFRKLVDRLPRVHQFWKAVLVFTSLVFAFAICDGFVACPKQGLAAVQCTTNAAALNKSLAVGTTVIVLDMVTDILILAIPVWLLWRVRIRPSQKLGLGAFLCLSIGMIVMAITRLSGLHYRGSFDNIWIFLWQQIEACIAVTMLSLTAFRSIFVEAKPGSDKASPWVPSTTRLLARRKKPNSSDQCLDNLTIPSATLTGLSQTFRQKEEGQSFDEACVSEEWPLPSRTSHNSHTHV